MNIDWRVHKFSVTWSGRLFVDLGASRELSIAITNVEQSMMWYGKHYYKNVKGQEVVASTEKMPRPETEKKVESADVED